MSDKPVWDLVLIDVNHVFPDRPGLLDDIGRRCELARVCMSEDRGGPLYEAYQQSLGKLMYLREAFRAGHNTWGMYQAEIRSCARLREMIEEATR